MFLKSIKALGGECQYSKSSREQAFLSDSKGSSNGTQRFKVIRVDPISSNELNVTGAFYYEADPVIHTINYKYLPDKSVRVKADWNDNSSLYIKCRD